MVHFLRPYEPYLFNNPQKREKGQRFINIQFFWIICFLLLLNTSYFSYLYGIGYSNLEELLSNKQLFVITFGVCIISPVLATNIILFLSHLKWFIKCFLYALVMIVLVLIWISDQNFSGYDADFSYGYYASRGVIGVYFLLQFLSLIIMYPNVLLFRYHPKFGRILYLIIIIIISTITIIFLFQYFRRVSTFRKGLFGLNLDLEESNCQVDDDFHLWSHYLPKYFFQLILLTYFCNKKDVFTTIIPTNEKNKISKVKINCPLNKELVIKKIPNIHYFTYDELKAEERNNYISVYSKSIYQKMEIDKISDRISNEYIYSYDSDHYETIFVECGNNMKNSITQPKKVRIKDREPPVTQNNDELSWKKRPNIYFILMESMSRKSFERSLSKTFSMLYKKSILSKEIDFFQFFNYKAIGANTYPNTLGLLNGVNTPNLKPVFEYAKKEGYVTTLTDDYCNEWSSLFNHIKELSGENKDEMYLCDYVHVEPTCDESYTPRTRDYSPWIGSSCSARRCLFQKEAHEYPIEYSKEIINLFKDVPKWIYLGIVDGHEATGESIHYVDKNLSLFMEFLQDSGELERSIIFFLGDHGSHLNFVANTFKQGTVEGNNPGLYVMFPNGFLNEEKKEIISKNQHKVVVPFDVHKTMCKLIGSENCDENNEVGKVLFEELISYDRNCEDSSIPTKYCDLVCKK